MRKYTEQYALSYTGYYHRCLAVLQENDVRKAKPMKEEFICLGDVNYKIVLHDKEISCYTTNYDDALDFARNYEINALAMELKNKGILDNREFSFVVICTNTNSVVHSEIVYIADIVNQ